MTGCKTMLTLAVSLSMAAVAGSALAQGSGATVGPAPVVKPKTAPAAPATAAAPAPTRAPAPRRVGLDEMKAALKLKPSQMEAWAAYETALKARADQELPVRSERKSRDGTAATPTEPRAQAAKQGAQASENVAAARDKLVATLSPEQKATFEQMRPATHGPQPRRQRAGSS